MRLTRTSAWLAALTSCVTFVETEVPPERDAGAVAPAPAPDGSADATPSASPCARTFFDGFDRADPADGARVGWTVVKQTDRVAFQAIDARTAAKMVVTTGDETRPYTLSKNLEPSRNCVELAMRLRLDERPTGPRAQGLVLAALRHREPGEAFVAVVVTQAGFVKVAEQQGTSYTERWGAALRVGTWHVLRVRVENGALSAVFDEVSQVVRPNGFAFDGATAVELGAIFVPSGTTFVLSFDDVGVRW